MSTGLEPVDVHGQGSSWEGLRKSMLRQWTEEKAFEDTGWFLNPLGRESQQGRLLG